MDKIITISPEVLKNTFNGKKVIVYLEAGSPIFLCKELKYLGVHVLGCYVEKQPAKIERLKLKCLGIRYLGKSQFLSVAKKENVMIQVQANSMVQEEALKEKLHNHGLLCSDISSLQVTASFFRLACLQRPAPFLLRCWKKLCWHVNCKRKFSLAFAAYRHRAPKDTIIICMPMKTADYTLINTFCANDIHFFNSSHDPKFINKKSCTKQFGTLKIITALRDPISQNLSSLFQVIATNKGVRIYEDWTFGDSESKIQAERKITLRKAMASTTEGCYDVQNLFDAFIERYIYSDVSTKTVLPRSIQSFSYFFKHYILDITKYPFNTEKGYTIIKEGDVEIFIYQLEKLNELVPELSEWTGTSFDHLINGNEASDKWIAESYKQAQKEIEITQEYFDKCFDEPYVKHCYSEADIERFKARWRSHINK